MTVGVVPRIDGAGAIRLIDCRGSVCRCVGDINKSCVCKHASTPPGAAGQLTAGAAIDGAEPTGLWTAEVTVNPCVRAVCSSIAGQI